MITFKIVNAQPILEKMIAFDLPLPSALKLSKIVTEINEVYKIYSEKRVALFTKYGSPQKENPEQIIISPENTKEFQGKMQELLESEIELEIKKLNIADLGTDVKLSAADFGAVSWLFNTEE